jgi:hypothetical protein
MPQWIHGRANHIRAKNPGMPKSESFAIATQQAYGAGKAPKKDFGTSKGKKEALKKYDEPKKDYEKTPDPGQVGKEKFSMTLQTWRGFRDELEKIAEGLNTTSTVARMAKGKSSLFKTPKMTSRPTAREPEPPAAVNDNTSSARAIQPPPVTAATTV